eukprot:Blabericola_migrator_1__12@NODE_1004_length_5726_cov_209_116982_g158_i3_p1_GENE_NODE_1004_length_5726_cov_209_116982_g158_i3NODE_1004_length_5726_cov_209_116982_g158_i3_p1_ORF_typecomplete_len1061_score185_39UCH/PF00443_29/1_6e55UCH_1/PF13423_6/2_4e05UCH_1/PF13423_6/2_6e09zfMYND/PF01753_18/0_0027zfMYND/PF01753_18/9_5e03zfMYND/PF01753_18/1_8e04zfMYND/PF01753_18/1_4e04_NODE_1004_length_5726_cov_209_116982_g158_i35513733
MQSFCWNCGQSCKYTCCRCKAARYCSERCQQLHHPQHRELCPKWVEDSRRGIQNMGTSCWLASSLQLLNAVINFRHYFTSGFYKMHLTKDDLLCSHYADVLNQLHTSKYMLQVDDFKRRIDRITRMFPDYEQHDAQEFLSWLLDELHEETNLARKADIETDEAEDPAPEESADLETKFLHAKGVEEKRSRSYIHSLFSGWYYTSLECRACKFRSSRFDKMLLLSLTLPPADSRVVRLVYFPRNFGVPLVSFIRVSPSWSLKQLKASLAEKLFTLEDHLVIGVGTANCDPPIKGYLTGNQGFFWALLESETLMLNTPSLKEEDMWKVWRMVEQRAAIQGRFIPDESAVLVVYELAFPTIYPEVKTLTDGKATTVPYTLNKTTFKIPSIPSRVYPATLVPAPCSLYGLRLSSGWQAVDAPRERSTRRESRLGRSSGVGMSKTLDLSEEDEEDENYLRIAPLTPSVPTLANYPVIIGVPRCTTPAQLTVYISNLLMEHMNAPKNFIDELFQEQSCISDLKSAYETLVSRLQEHTTHKRFLMEDPFTEHRQQLLNGLADSLLDHYEKEEIYLHEFLRLRQKVITSISVDESKHYRAGSTADSFVSAMGEQHSPIMLSPDRFKREDEGKPRIGRDTIHLNRISETEIKGDSPVDDDLQDDDEIDVKQEKSPTPETFRSVNSGVKIVSSPASPPEVEKGSASGPSIESIPGLVSSVDSTVAEENDQLLTHLKGAIKLDLAFEMTATTEDGRGCYSCSHSKGCEGCHKAQGRLSLGLTIPLGTDEQFHDTEEPSEPFMVQIGRTVVGRSNYHTEGLTRLSRKTVDRLSFATLEPESMTSEEVQTAFQLTRGVDRFWPITLRIDPILEQREQSDTSSSEESVSQVQTAARLTFQYRVTVEDVFHRPIRNSAVSLESLFYWTFRESHTDWKCDKCSNTQGNIKVDKLWDLGPVVLVQMNRFVHMSHWISKNSVPVKCPMDAVEWSSFTLRNKKNQRHYQLMGLITHLGSDGHAGHYVSQCRTKTGEWAYFDDELDTLVPPELEGGNRDAYILAYCASGIRSDMPHPNNI